MATSNCLEADSVQQIPIIQGEEDVNSSALILENHNSELNNPIKPKTVHQFYFVKFHPFEDPDEASKISEAEKRLQQLEQEATRINDICKMLRPAWRFAWSQFLELQRYHPRNKNISSSPQEKDTLDRLQRALDKLNMPNAHRVANNSTFSNNKQNTYHGYKRKTLHGSSNMAVERQLLREIDRSQERLALLPEHVLLWDTARYNNESDEDKTDSGSKNKGKKGSKDKHRRKDEIERRKGKALVDAIAKGEPWDPLSAKRAIQEQIKTVNQIILERERCHREGFLEFERLEKYLDAFHQDAQVLVVQRREIRRKLQQAQGHLSFLRLRAEDMNRRYEENLLMCMNRARELARKKDVASLTRLSRWQVKEFMSKWNQNSYFRVNYEISVIPSLERRGLRRDGRSKSCDTDNDTCRDEAQGPTNMAIPFKMYSHMTYDEF